MQTGSLPSDNPYVQQYQTRQTHSGRAHGEAHSPEEARKKDAPTDSVDISPEARAAAEAAADRKSSTEVSAGITVEVETEEKPAGVVGGDITKAADRAATGEYYDSVLKGLREQYDEKEALRRFDEFMVSEGFELTPATNDDGRAPIPGMNQSDRWPVSWTTMGMGDFLTEQGLFTTNIGSSLHLHSYLEGIATADGMETVAYSDATYRSALSDAEKSFLDSVKAERAAAFADQTDIDLGAYLGGSSSNSVTGVSSELADDLMRWFGDNGIEFDGDDMINMRLTRDEDGNFTGIEAFAKIDDQDSGLMLRKYLKDDLGDDIFNKLVAMYNSADFADPSGTGIEYEDGDRSVAVRQERSFSFRASDPSAVVMHDQITFDKTGYVYQKRVADGFSTEADTINVLTTKTGDATMSAAELEKELQDVIVAAKESGGLVESTMSEERYAEIKPDRSGHSTMPVHWQERAGDFVLEMMKAQGRYIDPSTVKPMQQPELTVVRIPEDWDPDSAGGSSTPAPSGAAEEETVKDEAPVEEAAVVESADAGKSGRDRVRQFIESLRAAGNNQQADMLNDFFNTLREWYAKKA